MQTNGEKININSIQPVLSTQYELVSISFAPAITRMGVTENWVKCSRLDRLICFEYLLLLSMEDEHGKIVEVNESHVDDA